jgi:hypothetical protein
MSFYAFVNSLAILTTNREKDAAKDAIITWL